METITLEEWRLQYQETKNKLDTYFNGVIYFHLIDELLLPANNWVAEGELL